MGWFGSGFASSERVTVSVQRYLPSSVCPEAEPSLSASSEPTEASRDWAIARACAMDVFVPPSAGCCGFAGDRGFLHPELTAAATAEEARELAQREFDGYYATSRTCEIGLERATGWPWRSIWRLLDEVSR